MGCPMPPAPNVTAGGGGGVGEGARGGTIMACLRVLQYDWWTKFHSYGFAH